MTSKVSEKLRLKLNLKNSKYNTRKNTARWWLRDSVWLGWHYILFISFILQLLVKKFHQTKQDPFFILLGSRFVETKFSHVNASASLSGIKKLINTSVWKNPYKYISINRSYFYCIFTTHITSICEKKVNKRYTKNHISQALEYHGKLKKTE